MMAGSQREEGNVSRPAVPENPQRNPRSDWFPASEKPINVTAPQAMTQPPENPQPTYEYRVVNGDGRGATPKRWTDRAWAQRQADVLSLQYGHHHRVQRRVIGPWENIG